MELLKEVMYAGLGLAKQAEEKTKEQFKELVEKGKQTDADGKNVIGDFFQSIDDGKEKVSNSTVVQTSLQKVEDFIKTLKSED